VVALLPARQATLVLCTSDGTLLGVLPPYDVATPWWQGVDDVVAGAQGRYRVDVTVLRLLSAAEQAPSDGGAVTYLAEVDAASARDLPLAAVPAGMATGDEPLRQPWACPGGPAADLAWAEHALAAHGIATTGPARQLRTWNLSSVWRLATENGPAWLKVVPGFFAHEGPVLAELGRADPGLVPPLLAELDGRVLMRHVPGEDLYHAPPDQLPPMVDLLVHLQARWCTRVEDLLAMGLPDWRPGPLAESVARTVDRVGPELDSRTRSALDDLVDGLPGRLAEVESCGVPTSLVHGDFHPGNLMGDGTRLVLLDWGDCSVGHPLLDQAAFLSRQAPSVRDDLRSTWSSSWRAVAPGSDPARAMTLLAPVADLRLAAVYQMFLDSIEPTERVYHASDPLTQLRLAAAYSGAEER
jgi:Ser/Thr protein kinase RdoA (MazF antagonist)